MKTILKKLDASKINLEANTEYMVNKITEICEKIGPRAPGSKEEFAAQQLMGEDLKKWSDDVSFEEFIVHRQAFMGFIPFTVAMAIIATVLYFSYPLVSFILTVLGFIPLILEFLMYKQFIDPLFKGHRFLEKYSLKVNVSEVLRVPEKCSLKIHYVIGFQK